MAAPPKVGRLKPKNTILFICDLQERYQTKVKYFNEIVEVSNRLIRVAKLLDLPIVVTEQFPKGLGRTVKALALHDLKLRPYEKNQFTMVIPDIEKLLLSYNPPIRSILLCGIEAHATIQMTAMDLISKGFEVHVIADACSSRTLTDRNLAFKRMRQVGAFITTAESAILMLVYDAAHPKFHEVQKIITPLPPYTELH